MFGERISTITPGTIVVAFGFLAGVVGCGSSPPSVNPPVPRVTSGSDARSHGVPKVEAVNPRAAKFAELDTDHDGKLSLKEFGAGRTSKSSEKWFGRRDADHDGFISVAEFLPFSAPGEKPEASGGKQGEKMQRDAALPPGESPTK